MSIAFFLSFFIYLSYFHINLLLINTIFGIIGLYFFILEKKEINFWSGFFVGIFWFYWISLSFRYYNLSYLIPFVIFGIAFVYGLFFLFISYFKNPFIRAFLLLVSSYIHPFEFSWFKPELIFTESYIGITKWQFAIILFAIATTIYFYNKTKKKVSFLFLLLSIFAFNFHTFHQKKLPFKIYLYDARLPQNIKWNPKYTQEIISNNIKNIKKAIKEKKDIIILNETAFPLCLNKDIQLNSLLKRLSKKIVIVTGALNKEKNGYYNSAYYFINGKMTIINKVVLVPFGEKIPLPKFLAHIINKIFFGGAEDFKTAKKVTSIKIKGVNFTNAICYEITENIIYKNHPKYIIGISNNGWFTPSIEPTLQNILIKFYVKKYHVCIIHSANMGISGVFF